FLKNRANTEWQNKTALTKAMRLDNRCTLLRDMLGVRPCRTSLGETEGGNKFARRGVPKLN
ncbi:hypothetical protein ACC684_37720, partial [Rhizobium ruizarguesonis]